MPTALHSNIFCNGQLQNVADIRNSLNIILKVNHSADVC